MSRLEIALDDVPWLLWRDLAAEWRKDKLHLPGEFVVSGLPVNPPTGGWAALQAAVSAGEARAVELPATVEQHFWGAEGLRDYTHDEYYFASHHPNHHDGIYRGVSWWWRDIDVPPAFAGRRMKLFVPAARLRVEVFVNEILVGYDLIGETPFEVDITLQVRPGTTNRIALRITNPGGRMDWIDYNQKTNPLATGPFLKVAPLRWGDHEIPMSHGFGGLDAGIRLVGVVDTTIRDIAIRNRADVLSATAVIELENARDVPANLLLETLVQRVVDGTTIWRGERQITLAPGVSSLEAPFACPDAEAWSPENPVLHRFCAILHEGDEVDRLDASFGFRWFEIAGIGNRATLKLNGRRIRFRGAISWNYWAPVGLFPTGEGIAREIASARALGLNFLSCHRNIGNPRALDASDRHGILRMEEPGAGREAWAGSDFGRAYMREKLRRMVRRDRNHPSLIAFCLQNEQVIEPPGHNGLRDTMAMVRETDPTRLVLLKSGFAGDASNYPPRWAPYANNQAYYLPGDPTLHADNGSGWCGWWDNHTVGGPGQYMDWLYQSPENYSHSSTRADEIVFWGEALGSGNLDALDEIAAALAGGQPSGGYSASAHAELIASYERFIDEAGFRDTYPSAGALARSVGNRSYDFWGRVIENVRICDTVDGIAMSGWESTVLDNHTGLVDAWRNLKGDPGIVSYYTRPALLAVKVRGLVCACNGNAVFDVFVVNEAAMSGRGVLTISLVAAGGEVRRLAQMPVALAGGDVFGELLARDLSTGLMTEAGHHQIIAQMVLEDGRVVDGQETIFVAPAPRPTAGVAFRESGEPEVFAGFASVPAEAARAHVLYDAHGSLQVGSELLERVAEGAGLAIIADGSLAATNVLTQLDAHGVLTLHEMVGPPLMSWYGAWYFSRPHPLLAGLPAGECLGWQFQADPRGAGGVWMDLESMKRFADAGHVTGPTLETVIGYGRDHHTVLGSALFGCTHGRARIVVSSMAGFGPALAGNPAGFAPPTARALLDNMIAWITVPN